jgi:hypothetical protein
MDSQSKMQRQPSNGDNKPDRLDPPAGFTVFQASDGRDYLVPDFMVSSVQVALRVQESRGKLNVDAAAKGVRPASITHLFVS